MPGARRPAAQVQHPYLGYALRPHGWDEDTEINELGFRGPSPLVGAAEGELSVLVLGGSVASALATQAGSCLAERVAATLGQDPSGIRLFNGALGGYRQPQQLMAVAYLLALGAKLDLVVNLDGFNEVALYGAEDRVQETHPSYPRNWARRLDSHRAPAAIVGRRVAALHARLAGNRAPRWGPLRLGLRGALALLSSIEERLDARLRRTRALSSGDCFSRRYADEGELLRELVALWSASSLQLHRLCAANGAAYFHFLQPNQYYGARRLSDAERARAYDPHHPYRPGVVAGYPRLIQAGVELAAQGLDFFDLTGVFDDTPDDVYLDSCCHFTVPANQLLAAEIGRRIAACLRRKAKSAF
jgi:hypothetical protein